MPSPSESGKTAVAAAAIKTLPAQLRRSEGLPQWHPCKRRKRQRRCELLADGFRNAAGPRGAGLLSWRVHDLSGSSHGLLIWCMDQLPRPLQMAAEHDALESGFCVSVHFASGKRVTPGEEMRGDWRSGIVMRAYRSTADDEMVYDIMMAEGREERLHMRRTRCPA